MIVLAAVLEPMQTKRVPPPALIVEPEVTRAAREQLIALSVLLGKQHPPLARLSVPTVLSARRN